MNKTVNKNAADILSNIATKISHSIATNYPKNAGVATTEPEASENRKTLRQPYLYRYNKIVGGDIYKGF